MLPGGALRTTGSVDSGVLDPELRIGGKLTLQPSRRSMSFVLCAAYPRTRTTETSSATFVAGATQLSIAEEAYRDRVGQEKSVAARRHLAGRLCSGVASTPIRPTCAAKQHVAVRLHMLERHFIRLWARLK